MMTTGLPTAPSDTWNGPRKSEADVVLAVADGLTLEQQELLCAAGSQCLAASTVDDRLRQALDETDPYWQWILVRIKLDPNDLFERSVGEVVKDAVLAELGKNLISAADYRALRAPWVSVVES